MASVKVDIDKNNEHVAVVVDSKPFYFSYAEDFILDVDGEPMYDDAEDFIMHSMSGLDEGLVKDVVPQIATKLHPFIEKYLNLGEKMQIKITKEQLEAIKSLTDDISSMIGCGETDERWEKQVKLIDKMLSNNKLEPRAFK